MRNEELTGMYATLKNRSDVEALAADAVRATGVASAGNAR